MEDIGEGQTGFVAELWVAHQFLEKGLSDWLSGVGPQPLGGSVPGNHLAVYILSGLPVASREKQNKTKLLSVLFQWAFFPMMVRNNMQNGGTRRTIPATWSTRARILSEWQERVSPLFPILSGLPVWRLSSGWETSWAGSEKNKTSTHYVLTLHTFRAR